MIEYETVEVTAKNVYVNGVLVTSELAPIVRCKDCKYYSRSTLFKLNGLMVCGNVKNDNDVHSEDRLVVNDDFFCAYGERVVIE